MLDENVFLKHYLEHVVQGFTSDKPVIKEFLNVYKPNVIADIGAGLGRLTDIYLELSKFIQLINLVEPNTDSCSKLKQKYAHNKNISIFDGNGYQTKVPSESCDGLIYGYGSFAECSPNLFTLHEANRILKLKGHALIWSINIENIGKLGNCLRTITDSQGNIHNFYAKTIRYKDLGPFECRTEYWPRGKSQLTNFAVSQNFADINTIENLASQSGFKVIKKMGSSWDTLPSEKCEVFYLIIRKETNISDIKPTPNNDQSIEVMNKYDEIADNYDAFINAANYKVKDFIQSESQFWQNTNPRVLDLGCGTGLTGQLLIENGIKPEVLLGIDNSKKMLKLAKHKNIYNGLAYGDLNQEISIERQSYFDLILCLGVLEFIEDPFKRLSEIRKLLVVGGELWLSFETTDHHLDLKNDVVVDSNTYNFKKIAYNADFLKETILKLGFQIVSFIKSDGYKSPTLNKNISYCFFNLRRDRT